MCRLLFRAFSFSTSLRSKNAATSRELFKGGAGLLQRGEASIPESLRLP
jgi:hypothetical protein